MVKNIAKLLIADLEGKIDDLPIDMKASIKHSLFQTKKKTKDYLWILANSMQIYKFKDLEGLVNGYLESKSSKKFSTDILFF